MLDYLQSEYNVFPPENLTPHIILTKWNITDADGNLTIKFRAHNFGKKTYNATLMMELMPKPAIINLEGDATGTQNWEIKLPDKQVINIGEYRVPSMREIEREVSVPLNGTKVKNLQMRMVSE